MLESLAQENNVEILGHLRYLELSYILSCTKGSAGNSLQMANLFYETELFEYAAPDIVLLNAFHVPTPILSLSSDVTISSFASQIIVDAKGDGIDYIEVYALDGRLLFSSSYGNVPSVSLNLPVQQGVMIVKVKLQSGSVLHKKLLLK